MTNQKKILVVDDDPSARLVLRKFLEGADSGIYDVIEAEDGFACLMAVEKQGPISLILLDIDMPEMDGISICRAIRRVDSEIPIVFVTAHADVANRVNARDAGGDSFVTKPVNPGNLLALVKVFTKASWKRPRSYRKPIGS